jgi:hypothetical protein
LEDELILNQLEELTEKLGITVRRENVNAEGSSSSGGLCRLKGKYVLIIDSQASRKEKIRVIKEALKRFDLGDVYVRPGLRELLEGSED